MGSFNCTLPVEPIGKFSWQSIDEDMYESTKDAMVNMNPKLPHGGILIVDDYCIEMCKKAITDYQAANNIKEKIIEIDDTGVCGLRVE